MKVNAFSNLLLGTILTVGAGSIASCTYNNYDKNAKKEAMQYLNEFEQKQAERASLTQDKTNLHCTPVTVYWDQVLLREKIKQAYRDGLNYIKDSLNNNFSKDKEYKINLNQQYNSLKVNEQIREELSEMLTTQEFNDILSNEPDEINKHRIALGCSPAEIHYWDAIIMVNEQKNAYERGKTDMREVHLNQ